MDQDQHDDEDMDPYRCFIVEEQPLKQADDMEATKKVDVDMEDYRCFIVEEHS